MNTCEISVFLANSALAYILGSVYYLFITRFYDTSFSDALQQYPELLEIKKKAVSKRSKTFYFGMLLAIVSIWYFKPFKTCF